MKYVLVIFAAFLAFSAADQGFDSNEVEISLPFENFKMFTLAQMWPQTSCWKLNGQWNEETTSCTSCSLPNSSDRWTLHGLWPSNKKGPHPSFCRVQYKYTTGLMNPQLRAVMSDKWRTYKANGKNDGFWEHEWEKHGTCALDLESTNSAQKYFLKALELLDMYNVGDILRSRGIVPGHEYDVNDMIKTIHGTLGVHTFINCAKNKESHKQYLMEVSLCFDKTFRLINCDDNGVNVSSCKRKEKVVYSKDLKSCNSVN